jgi:predicted methyltransferase
MRTVFLAAAGLVLAAAASASFASGVALNPTKVQLAAVADANRPKEDVERGDKVADLIPGKGYFTRLFADAVGPKGVVYMYEPSEFAKFAKSPLPANGAHPDTARSNIVFLTGPANDFAAPQKLDIVWTSQNYHDLKDSFAAPADTAQVNKAVFAALKPGGVYIVLDHVALPGAADATEKLHRIDPAIVRKEVEAAGFVFDGETDVLRNPNDPHDVKVFDPSIRGRTDQFVYRFRKPKS